MRFRRVEIGIVPDDKGRSVPDMIIDQGRHVKILEIVDRWYEGALPGRPEVAYFKARTHETRIYILRHAMLFDAWGACELKDIAPGPDRER